MGFLRRSKPVAAPQPAPSRAGQVRHTAIAEVELIKSIGVATLTVTELNDVQGVEQLHELMTVLTDLGVQHHVLDTGNVRYMDSACLGVLVEALLRISRNGGEIIIANPDRNIEYLFKMTRLNRVFRICPDVITAMETVSSARAA
jgi:anti-sigma B factor antagonist